jgi:hypothetical protein
LQGSLLPASPSLSIRFVRTRSAKHHGKAKPG